MLAAWDSQTFVDMHRCGAMTVANVWHRGRRDGTLAVVYDGLRVVGLAVHDPTGHIERCGMLERLEREVGK